MSAQSNYHCATPDPTTPDPEGVYSYSTDMDYFIGDEPVVLNVFFWGIMHPDGTNYFPNRGNDALQAIANLNILYNQFNIFFKYRGYEEIESPALPNDPNGYFVLETTSQYNAMLAWAAANGHKKADAFNVYAFGWAEFGGGIASLRGLTCGVNSGPDGLNGKTLLHEISHNLNLLHTRSPNEHATRDPNNPYFNADVAGDRVVDTAANSGFWDYGCECTPFVDPLTCEYFGTEKDELGDPYKIFHGDVINLMGNAYGCDEAFLFPGQGIRAREAIAAGYYNVAITTIASLYEPYAGVYFTPNSPIDPIYKPLFQPGFEYRFLECSCDCPEPAPYEDTSFFYTQNIIKQVSKYETDFGTIYHPNHTAIGIKIENQPIFWPQPRRCYDNPYRRPIGGSVLRFNDNVFNSNITVTPKDSLGINHPQLIEQLQPGLYKIEKVYAEGNKEEDVIFKLGE